MDDNLLLLLNASHHGVKFTLPPVAAQLPRLELLLNTAVAQARAAVSRSRKTPSSWPTGRWHCSAGRLRAG